MSCECDTEKLVNTWRVSEGGEARARVKTAAHKEDRGSISKDWWTGRLRGTCQQSMKGLV